MVEEREIKAAVTTLTSKLPYGNNEYLKCSLDKRYKTVLESAKRLAAEGIFWLNGSAETVKNSLTLLNVT